MIRLELLFTTPLGWFALLGVIVYLLVVYFLWKYFCWTEKK
jgi:hypothetical protein